MKRQWMIFAGCGFVAALALVLGGFLVAAHGFEPPPWLLGAVLAVLCLLGLACGFTAVVPAALPYLRMRPVQGTLLIVFGVSAMFVPAQFVASAVLLAFGTRLVWREACELADRAERQPAAGTAVVKAAGDRLPAEPVRAVTPAVRPVAETLPDLPPRVAQIGSVTLLLGDD